MTRSRPLSLLTTLGALSAVAGAASAAVDTSQWKCESCPFEKGASGGVEVGVGANSERSAKFGDYTGLDRKGAFAIVGGDARWRGENGLYGSFDAADLGLDTRTLSMRGGLEGVFSLQFGYAEIPHLLSDSAATPFRGVGSGQLTRPFAPGATTGDMALGDALEPVEIGFKRKRLDAGASLIAGSEWTSRLALRHDVRDGTQRSAGSFYSSASQLVAPVDQVTDQLDLSLTYGGRELQATLAYQVSVFRNGESSLTWDNPFTPVVSSGATRGQLALAPDNQFHQLSATAAYQFSPEIRASGEVAFGRMTQDDPYLKATLNDDLAVTLPRSSLQGKADTFNASIRLSATSPDGLRANVSYARDVRDNRTASDSYPAVVTDMFVGTDPRRNQPFSFTQDRLRFNADYRWPNAVQTSAGIDEDDRERSNQEVTTTRETTLWGRIAGRPAEPLSLVLKVARAERRYAAYGVATWIDPAENPLLRKYNLADRDRSAADLRADIAVAENVSLGLNASMSFDRYGNSAIGLTDGRTTEFGGDLSAALTEQTQLHAYAQAQRLRSNQAGSQTYAQPDWRARARDAVNLVGVGLTHNALKGKLQLGADVSIARSRSETEVLAGPSDPPFPTATTAVDSLRLQASWRFDANLTLVGSYLNEGYRTHDWRLEGVQPATVPNLLALGEQPPQYRANVVRLALRYRF